MNNELAEIEAKLYAADRKVYNLRGAAHDLAQTERAELIKKAETLREEQNALSEMRLATQWAGELRKFQRWALG